MSKITFGNFFSRLFQSLGYVCLMLSVIYISGALCTHYLFKSRQDTKTNNSTIAPQKHDTTKNVSESQDKQLKTSSPVNATSQKLPDTAPKTSKAQVKTKPNIPTVPTKARPSTPKPTEKNGSNNNEGRIYLDKLEIPGK